MAQQLGYLNDGHNRSTSTHSQYTPLRTHIHTHTYLSHTQTNLCLAWQSFMGLTSIIFFVVACEARLIFTYTSTVIYLYVPLSYLMLLFMTAPMA